MADDIPKKRTHCTISCFSLQPRHGAKSRRRPRMRAAARNGGEHIAGG